MHLKRLEIKNFKCFDDESIDFPDEVGVTQLTGRNLYQPWNGPNGIGKSSLMDAICWGLYEVDSQGNFAGELKNRYHQGGYSVKLFFTNDDGSQTVIFRQWSPNLIQMDGRAVVNEDVEAYIRLSKDQFLYTVYFNQDSEHFIDLTPGKKLEFLSLIFDLDQWVQASKAAQTLLTKHQTSQVQAKANQGSLIKQIEQHTVTLERLQHDSNNWHIAEQDEVKTHLKNIEMLEAGRATHADSEKLSRQQKLDATLVNEAQWREQEQTRTIDLVNQKRELEAQIPGADDAVVFEQVLEQANTTIKALELENFKISNERDNYKTTMLVADREISLLHVKKGDLGNTAGQTCITCNQSIDASHVGKQMQVLNDKLQIEVDKSKEAAAKVADLEPKIAALDSQIKEFKGIWQEADTSIKVIKSKEQQRAGMLARVAQLEAQINQAPVNPWLSAITSAQKALEEPVVYPSESLLVNLRERINARPVNPFLNTIEETTKVKTELLEQQAVADQLLANADQMVLEYEFWAKEFPIIRLWILDEMTHEFEVYFNQALWALGLRDMKVAIDTEKKLKTKDAVSKQLTVLLYQNDKEISLKTLSGGEKQRLRIASSIGLSDMIANFKLSGWRQRWLDEPLRGITNEGVGAFVDFIDDYAETHQVVVADHHFGDQRRFENTIYLTKYPNQESKIETSSEINLRKLEPIS